MKRNCCCSKLHAFSFAMALGIVWAISILLTGLIAWGTGYGAGFVETMRTIYIGYEATIVGSIIGAVWGFIDMFIAGFILAALYNFFCSLSCKNKCLCEMGTTNGTHKTASKSKKAHR